jgi:hypothetical protein
MKKVFTLWVLGFSLGFSASSQSFQNMGFESATLVPVSGSEPYIIQWNPAMPGWSGWMGQVQVTSLRYNAECLTVCTSLGIIDQPGNSWGAPLVGRYSAIISAGPYMGGPYQASIAQTGLIPSDAQSVRFFGLFNGSSQMAPSADELIVSVGGQSLPIYSSLAPSGNYRVYSADVSAFAGQTAELRFTVATEAAPPGQPGRGSHLMLDFIFFSATPVPEPAVGILLLVGVCILGGWKLRKT